MEQVKSNTDNLRGLNLAAAKRTAVQVAKQAAIVAQVNMMKHDLQYQASTDRGHVRGLEL